MSLLRPPCWILKPNEQLIYNHLLIIQCLSWRPQLLGAQGTFSQADVVHSGAQGTEEHVSAVRLHDGVLQG